MDESNTEGTGQVQDNTENTEPTAHPEATHDEAHRAAQGLRGQIAALRQQVKEAQDTLRDHKQRQETRSFKR